MTPGRRDRVREPGIEGLRNRRVGIWGTGREGLAMARLAAERGADLLMVRDRPPFVGPAGGKPLADWPSDDEIEVGGSTYQVSAPDALLDADLDLVVHSPGVSIYRPEFESLRAKGVPVTSATEIWFEDFGSENVIGVTGSKGKTTTASLAALVLTATDVDVGLGGNIGRPLTDFYDEPAHEVYVVEVSSYQAADLEMSPRVGALTLLSADHLDWHGNYERYVRDKLNLFAHRDDAQVAVNARCRDAVAATSRLGARRHLYGSAGVVCLRDQASVTVDGVEVGPFAGAVLRGRHNLENLCGALTVAQLYSGRWPDFARLAAAISTMPALPSRLESVAFCGGIEFVDDALASNPSGVIAALEAFGGQPVSLIVGGHDRGTDLAELVRALVSRSDVSLVHIDQLGRRLEEGLEDGGNRVDGIRAADLEEAVGLAAAALPGGERGGVVLFSPGAPTPPAEGSYVDRSIRFKNAVDAWVGAGTAKGAAQVGPTGEGSTC